mmetsp:Transcript_14083/g.33741  ORF Transcript_14083/g.33741 Transcript_14083/m.33741 type:complete len:388 (-) Transcript_14083:151-1314(-)
MISLVILAWRLRLYSNDRFLPSSLALSEAEDMAFMRAASSDARLSCSARRICAFMYSGSRESRIWLGSCSKVMTPSKPDTSVSTGWPLTANLPSSLVSVKITSSAASTHTPLTSQISPSLDRGRMVWMDGSATMSEMKREYTSSTLSHSSPTNSEYTSSAMACASGVLGDCPMANDFRMAYLGPGRVVPTARFLKYTEPFLPMVMSFTLTPISSSSFTRRSVLRMMKLLKPPHSPRSPVTTSSSTVLTGRTLHRGTSICSPARRVLMANSTLTSASLKGRALITASCARRTLAAATSFIASVILRVDFTLSIRSRISFWDAAITWSEPRPPTILTGAAAATTRAPEKPELLAWKPRAAAGLTAHTAPDIMERAAIVSEVLWRVGCAC